MSILDIIYLCIRMNSLEQEVLTLTCDLRVNHCVNVQGGLLYIPSLLNNRTMKLLTIYNTLHIPICNIFVKKEKYHEI